MSLLDAAKKGDAKKVEQLLKGNNNIDEANKGQTALHLAAIKGATNVVQLLLDAGADGFAETKDGKTAADLGAHNKHLAVVKVLKKWQDEQRGLRAQALFNDMDNLLKDGCGVYDLDIKVDGGTVRGHQCIVGLRCAYLKDKIAEKRGKSSKKGPAPTVELTIDNVTQAEMTILMTCMYTGKLGDVQLKGEELVSLLANSKRLGLTRCCALIEAHIRSRIDEENVLQTLRRSHELGLTPLKTFCLNYVITNYNKVVQRDLSVVGGDLLAEIMRTQADPKLLAEPDPVVVSANTLTVDLLRLLGSQEEVDFVPDVQGEEKGLGAHRAILAARCGYYANLFGGGGGGGAEPEEDGSSGKSRKSKSSKKRKDDGGSSSGSRRASAAPSSDGKVFASPECLKSFLTFLYSDDVDIHPQDAIYLFPDVASNFFKLSANELLMSKCDLSLKKKVNSDNVLVCYMAACDVDSEQLKQVALDKIVQDFQTVCRKEDMAKLEKEQLLDVVKAFGAWRAQEKSQQGGAPVKK